MQLLTPSLGLIVWTMLAFLDRVFPPEKIRLACYRGWSEKKGRNIAEALATAEKVKTEMAQMKNENEALLATAREERAKLLKEARETKDKIINEAKEQAKPKRIK